MANWTEVGIDVVTGGAAGAADQFIQNYDEKRRRTDEAAGKTFGKWKEIGTYFNYGVPVLGILATAMGWVSGMWATRAVLVGSQLAGRKLTYQFTKATQATPWRPAPEEMRNRPSPQRQEPDFEKVGII